MRDCFIIVERNCEEGLNAYAFSKEEDARKSVGEDVDVTVKSLQKEGYAPTVLKYDDDNVEVFVADSGIFYEWSIIVSQIR